MKGQTTSVRAKQIPISVHNLDVGKFTIYQNILVSEFKEGIHVNFENTALLIQIAQMAFGSEKPVVYISHRCNSYSINPVNYREYSELFPNFMGLAIVAQNKRRRMLAKLERFFIKKPIEVFDNMEDAFNWAEEMLEKSN